MPNQITKEECTVCGSCAEICSVNAIKYTPAAGVYQIKEDACINCGACESVCSNGAIRPLSTDSLPR